MNLTAIIFKSDDFFIGQIKELPGVLTQGISVEQTKKNLIDALDMWLEDAKEELKEETLNIVHREKFEVHVR